jgi:uroporphyrinogen decarboxylase
MNSKERFKATCEFKKVDRVPIDYVADYKIDNILRKHFKINSEDELLEILNSDFYYLPCRDISQNEGFLSCYKGPELNMTEKERVCPFGIRFTRGAYKSKFNVDEAIRGPLENARTPKEILKHRWPKPSDFDFSILHQECESHSDKVIIGGLWTGIMGDSYRMFGFENFLLNMATNPKLVSTLIDKMTEVYLELNEAFFEELKGKFDIWYFGNDFGANDGLLFSFEMWYKFFFKNIKELIDLAHKYDLKVMIHSDGSICELIPYMINAGADILDPIQVTAKGMDLESLAENYKEKIVFHGGIDVQRLLVNGTPEEVRNNCIKTINLFGNSGGYIFSPSQVIGTDIPIENIIAMYNTASGFDISKKLHK